MFDTLLILLSNSRRQINTILSKLIISMQMVNKTKTSTFSMRGKFSSCNDTGFQNTFVCSIFRLSRFPFINM